MAWINGFLIDDDMYDELSGYVIRTKSDGYGLIVTDKVKAPLSLHRYIMNAPEGSIVDHINGKVWDNRRENLRLADAFESAANRARIVGGTSKYKGVYMHVQKTKGYEYTYWWAKLKKYNKVVFKKRFDTELEAAKAYDQAAKEHHGEYAKLNFPDL